MKHKYYYTYRVQCTAVGWEDYYYLGKHVTSNLNDGYKGSGTKLHEYYKQYPEDYTFTIIAFYNNKTDLMVAEQELVGDLWKTDPYCLNLTGGGRGSWQHCKGKPLSEDHIQKVSQSLKGRSSPMKGKITWMKGKRHSEESKNKISESKKGKHRVYREDGSYYMSAE